MPQVVDPEEFREEWQEFMQEVFEEAAVDAVEQFYQDVLRQNLDSTSYLSNLPEEGREALADMAASVYADQAQRILDSEYVGQDELGMAVATALLDDKRQVKVGAQAQGIVDMYYDDMHPRDQRFEVEEYQKWAFEALTEPWPPQHFEDDWESVDRFKPGEDDPAYH